MKTRLLGLALMLAGCAGDDQGDVGSGEGGEAGDTSSDGDADTGTGDGTGDGTEGGSGGGSGGDGDGSNGSDTGVDACASSPMDGPCAACLKESCCTEFEQCEANAGCACVSACLDADGQYLTCVVECDLAPSDAALDGLAQCTQGPCAQACGA